MGLLHSGDVADLILYNNLERWALDPNLMKEHGIDLYIRFRDDIFILATIRSKTREYIWEMRKKAKYFKLECESISSIQCRFLDLLIKKALSYI